MKVLDAWLEEMTFNGVKVREERVRLLLRDRPRRLPRWAWHRLLRWLLTIETQDVTGNAQDASESAGHDS